MNELLSRIALAFGIGLLIGLERGWSSRQVVPGSRAAGVRTFAIAGLLGGIIGAIADGGPNGIALPGALIIAAAFASYSAVVAVFIREENRASGKYSATTAFAAILTFSLGLYAVLGNVHIATAAAVTTAAVLALREGIHGWIEKITPRELEAGLLLLAMTFIALPIVPARAVGPFGGVNIRELWIIAIVLASISFAAYIAVKYFGERKGVLLSAVIGGLVSSTAVTLSNARRAASKEGSPRMLAAAAGLATAVSFIRVTAIVGALSPSILFAVGLPLGAAALLACTYAVTLVYREPRIDTRDGAVTFRNPFGFWSVLAIAGSMGALILLGGYINERFGASGTLVAAASMGLFDVDAMTVAMSRLMSTSLPPVTVARAILVGAASNTVVKAAIAGAIGRGRFARDVALLALGCLAVGAGTMLLVVSHTR
jgi:uncharacterized membrane protein (DUF4010 family)